MVSTSLQGEYFAHFLPASVAQQQQNKEAGQQTIYNKLSSMSALLGEDGTYSHANCDHETNCWANNFAMTWVLITYSGQNIYET